MDKIIVTDLTRFSNPEIVCIAGIDVETGQCIRPMPYLKALECQQLKVLPGAILSGVFSPIPQASGPHQEDRSYKNLRFEGICSSEDFKAVLQKTTFKSIEDGFEISLQNNQKHIPVNHPIDRSIITIRADTSDIEIVEDNYKQGKLKLHFRDGSGRFYRFISITDLGFYRYAEVCHHADDLDGLNAFISSQSEAYLRIGLSRSWARPGESEKVYWMQVNGIYTFPQYHRKIRSYG